ncbi:MAG: hypothetical protein ABI471_10715 [Sphingomonas bacterium]
MFWRRGKTDTNKPTKPDVSFEEAKEATRRAAFLNFAGEMSEDEPYRQQLSELFRVCRSAALAAGALQSHSDGEVDAAIGALCDADNARLREASDEEFRNFARESGEIVNLFLSKI